MRVAARLLPSVEPWAVVDGAVLIGIAVITGTHYDTIDDVLINAFAAGRLLSSAPDEHLIYTNVIIGFPLKFLYLLWGAVPWYGLYLIVSLALSAAAFLWAFAELQRSWTGRALVLAFLVGTIATTFSNLQYTRVAFLAVESGWLLVASALIREGSPARGAAAAGAVLVLLGTCIRSEIGLLGTLLSAPLILASLLSAGRLRTWRDRLRLAALPAAVVLMSGLAIAGDIAYYRAQPSWRQYLAYHNARSTLLGTARGESNEIPAAVLEHVGWSANDLSMMYSYFGVNETVFSLDHQQYVIDHTGSWRWPFDSRSFETLRPIASDALWPLFFLVAAATLLVAPTTFSIATVGVSVGLLTGVVGLLAADWKLPDRFYEPALSIPAAAGLAVLAWRRADAARQPRFGSLAASTACVAVVLAVFHVETLSAGSREAQGDQRNMTSAVEQLNPRPGDLYVAWGGDFPYNHLVTPLGGFSAAGNLQLFPLVWANHAPFLTRRLVQFGVGDLYTAFWQRGNVLLISSSDRCERLMGFLALHYGQIVACVRLDGPLPIHRLVPVTVRGPSINVRWRADGHIE